MSTRRETFEALFRERSDPWDFETSTYEREKRKSTIAALGGRQFDHVLEIGCATGVTTTELAEQCMKLTAIDVSQTALDRARARMGDMRNVAFLRAEVPGEWPAGRFDAVILSEVLYFLSHEEIARTSRLAHRSLEPGGTCLLVNWTGENDCAVDGVEAVRIFRRSAPWRLRSDTVAPLYRIDLLTPSGCAADVIEMEIAESEHSGIGDQV